MCLPACTKKIAGDLVNRRGFLKMATSAATVMTAAACTPIVAPSAPAAANQGVVSFSRVVDLTHTLTPSFPSFGGDVRLEMETVVTLAADGYNMYRWLLVEHTGTHMDAPFHFSGEGEDASAIAAENLHGPLAVIDLRARAEEDPDTQLTPDDLAAWEGQHGPLPAGAIVALLSGWEHHVTSDRFRNADADGVLHFPGFHIETVEMMLAERDVKGIMVDTLSLDYGPSADFAVHYRWLPAGKWGIEAVANLGEVPAGGAHVIVGGPKVAGATGGPTRIFALV
jgi:kynurenine formamidase